MTDRLKFESSFDMNLKEQKIHPLLFQPLLENAFKYVGGDYLIQVQMQQEDSAIHFMARNSIIPDTDKKGRTGIGIENLRKRLNTG